MNDNDKERKKEDNKTIKEDTTKYGEMISSYFAWISPSKQKEKAERLEKIGKIPKK